MPCYSPLKGYRSRFVNDSGKRSIVFSVSQGFIDMPVTVPCGQCIGCRLEYSRQWAVRSVHEASLHSCNSFLTLTFAPEHMPENHSISKRDLVLFMKRLRKALGDNGPMVRYFACGEYGDKNNRPHYHMILFGYDFPDRELWSKKQGNLLYRSALLEKVWPYGFSTIGEVTFESCAYVARYVCKKLKGKDSPDYYEICDPETGEIHKQAKEFALMSRGSKKRGTGGIGKGWLEKFKSDTDKDFITLRGVKMSLPQFYTDLLEKEESEQAFFDRKQQRRKKAKQLEEDNTPDRLRQKESVKKAQIGFLHRELED